MGLNRAREPWAPGPVFGYAIELAQPAKTPKLCVITTAGGDQAETITRFEQAFAENDVELSVLALFDRPSVTDVSEHLRAQDVVWCDRGSLVNLLAVWRAHGLDKVLRECWEEGVVLGGESAGSLCWFSASTTDSFGPVRPHHDGLGLLPFANSVHYGDRREQFHDLLADGSITTGYATDAGAGLHFEGAKLVTAISDRPRAGAYEVHRGPDGRVHETQLEVRRLKRA
ncbi:Peptidase E (EC [Amycolatopsis camponoti]|uniref:Peptidase E (EC) n=1 Tax=Amycolatopsis camponoti TaxID=2606593 RepID=A0A6I8M3T1_9PSEU|nr:peptidase E [Amycolatopsis camponoti]VVJ22649.1 Peptidase E (EC [Amycolatopsis camponoti]